VSTQWRKRLSILSRDNWRCVFCDGDLTVLRATLDHLLPRSRGGTNDARNLAAACGPCNRRKGDKTLAEFGREELAAVIASRPLRLVEGPSPFPSAHASKRGKRTVAWPEGPRDPFVAAQLRALREAAATDYAAYLREIRVQHDLR
jgi:hypothetical protein